MCYKEVTAGLEPGRLLLFISKLCDLYTQPYDADQHKCICEHITVCNHIVTPFRFCGGGRSSSSAIGGAVPSAVWSCSAPSLRAGAENILPFGRVFVK